jgi:hypothetical protein
MKRVFIILGIIAALLLLGFFGLRFWTKSGSPEAEVVIDQDGFRVKVDYCRPYKKGRTIFGGLVPYGKVWRTGANEATIIELAQDVTIAGKPLNAGQYSLWTIPTPDKWMIIFNRETGQWGTNYNATEDVLRVPVSSRKHSLPVDQFTISFDAQKEGANMLLTWDETEAVVPIQRR